MAVSVMACKRPDERASALGSVVPKTLVSAAPDPDRKVPVLAVRWRDFARGGMSSLLGEGGSDSGRPGILMSTDAGRAATRVRLGRACGPSAVGNLNVTHLTLSSG